MDDDFIRFNFEDIDYNLYEILGVNRKCSMKRIKKAYRKLILKYHPDKDDNNNEELFNKITLAYQILSNLSHRKKYGKWLKSQKHNTAAELKQQYKKQQNNLKKSISTENVQKTFNEQKEEIEKRHYENVEKNFADETKLEERLKSLEENRNILSIEKKPIKDFNKEFTQRKNIESNEIIKNENEIIFFNYNESLDYTPLEHMNKLYMEDEKIFTNDFSSLNNAFEVKSGLDFNQSNLSLEELMEQHKKNREELINMDLSEYKDEKF